MATGGGGGGHLNVTFARFSLFHITENHSSSLADNSSTIEPNAVKFDREVYQNLRLTALSSAERPKKEEENEK